MGTAPLPSALLANPNIVLREEWDERFVLFDPDTGEIYPINSTGALVWKRLDGRHTMDAILRELEEEFACVPDGVGADVRSFLRDLIDRGMASDPGDDL